MSGVNHAGLSVPDLDRAIAWYRDVFELTLLRGPLVATADGPDGDRPADIFGPEFGEVRIAHLAGANGVGVELFEFRRPRAEPHSGEFAPWRTGIFHLAFTCPDLDAVLARLRRRGGRQRSAVHADGPVRICYCEDPFGNVLELVDAPYPDVNRDRED